MAIIEVEQLVKRYKDVLALDHFDLTVSEGEILGFLGPNGCGKTTAINCMLGLLTFDKGSVRLFGETPTPTSYHIKQQLGVVPQELAYFDLLTVYENIDFFCGLYEPNSVKRKELVEEALRFVDLGDYRKFKPRALSGGLKRRLNIACGIAHQPRLIFLDEPTVAVDAQSRNFILDGIKSLNAKGSTIVYTTHYLDEVDGLCDRIVIMDKGKNVTSGSAQQLKEMVSTKELIYLTLLAPPTTQFLAACHELPHILSVEAQHETVQFQFKQIGHNVINIAQLLQQHGLGYERLYGEQPSLNEVFLSFTGKELRD